MVRSVNQILSNNLVDTNQKWKKIKTNLEQITKRKLTLNNVSIFCTPQTSVFQRTINVDSAETFLTTRGIKEVVSNRKGSVLQENPPRFLMYSCWFLRLGMSEISCQCVIMSTLALWRRSNCMCVCVGETQSKLFRESCRVWPWPVHHSSASSKLWIRRPLPLPPALPYCSTPTQIQVCSRYPCYLCFSFNEYIKSLFVLFYYYVLPLVGCFIARDIRKRATW